MPISYIPCEFNDRLHPLHLSFDGLIEVFRLDFRESQEMDRASILFGIGGDEGPK